MDVVVNNDADSATSLILETNNNLNLGQWYYVVLTWEVSTKTLSGYLDNVAITPVVATGTFSSTAGDAEFNIGRRYNNALHFDGQIDEVRVFDHVLTAAERSRLFLWDGDKEVEVNGIDYSLDFIDFVIGRETIYSAAYAELIIADPDNLIEPAIGRYKEVKVYYQGTLRYTGLIIDVDPGDNTSHMLEIYSMGYWHIMLRSPVTATYTAQTWTQILTDIISNNEYVSGYNIGTSKIETTTNTESKEFLGARASGVAIEACMAEDFVAFIDENKDFIFKSNTKDDTGVHLVYADKDIRRENFKRTGGDIISVALVRGKTGSPPANKPVYAIVENDELKSKYEALPLEFNRPELSTIQECIDWGEREIKRRNESQTRGKINTGIDFALQEGSLVTLTIPQRSFTAQVFYIVSAKHTYSMNETELDLVYYSRTSADFINEILENSLKASQYLTDKAAVATKVKKLIEEITVTSRVDVERRTYSGAQYGEFNYSEKYYGQVSGAWTSVIADQSMKVTNLALEDFLRIFAQIATVPTILDSDNTYVALGSGTTTVQYSDTTLESETFRLPITAGHPLQSTSGEFQLETVIGDATTITATLSNLGVFNASSNGNMESAIVLSSSISKAADEEIRFTVRFKFVGASYLSTAGANLLRDYIAGFELADFLDNTNSAIEIITDAPTTYKEGMEATHPKFINATKDSLRYQIDIETTDIVTAGLDGEAFVIMDLYNKVAASTGVKVIDGTVGSATFSNLQNIFAQIVLKMVR